MIDKNNKERAVQNKVTIAIFNITLFVALVTLFETVVSLPYILSVGLYVLMGIPSFFYFLYLVFLSLRYKSSYPNTFFFLEDLEISVEKVDKFYDLGSSLIFSLGYGFLIFILKYLIGKGEESFNIVFPWWGEVIVLGLFPFLFLKIFVKVLKLSYADYILDEKFDVLRKKNKISKESHSQDKSK